MFGDRAGKGMATRITRSHVVAYLNSAQRETVFLMSFSAAGGLPQHPALAGASCASCAGGTADVAASDASLLILAGFLRARECLLHHQASRYTGTNLALYPGRSQTP